jgi:hypothetical protein
MVKTMVLAIHQDALGLRWMRSLSPLTAMTRAKHPLMRDKPNANSPRPRHPNTSTGVSAIAKKINGTTEGITM